MQTRVYTDKINIDNNSTKEFWQKRANNINNLQTVLLGSDNTGSEQNIRNENEKRIVEKIIEKIQNPGILDIGCGIGRWAENLQNKFEYYVGVDFSEGFINYALTSRFNLIICTGVLMYINDENISNIFKAFRQVSPEYLYIQESISLMEGRLTLNKFESKDLKTDYSAIYRTKQEYEEYFKTNAFNIIKTDLLLDNKSGAREETNAQYWILKG